MKRKVNHYADEFKYQVIQEYLTTDISQVDLQKKYSIGGNNCINYWMRKFGTSEITVEQINLHRLKVQRTVIFLLPLILNQTSSPWYIKVCIFVL